MPDITLNGRKLVVDQTLLAYEEVVRLAFDPAPAVLVTVTYHNADGHRPDGVIGPGDAVKVKNGTVINAAITT